jgi:hypothetical protein
MEIVWNQWRRDGDNDFHYGQEPQSGLVELAVVLEESEDNEESRQEDRASGHPIAHGRISEDARKKE